MGGRAVGGGRRAAAGKQRPGGWWVIRGQDQSTYFYCLGNERIPVIRAKAAHDKLARLGNSKTAMAKDLKCLCLVRLPTSRFQRHWILGNRSQPAKIRGVPPTEETEEV